LPSIHFEKSSVLGVGPPANEAGASRHRERVLKLAKSGRITRRVVQEIARTIMPGGKHHAVRRLARKQRNKAPVGQILGIL
jgi:hypothetical protein